MKREPLMLPAGLDLPDGRILTFRPHRECKCADCREAFGAWRDGWRWLIRPGALPW